MLQSLLKIDTSLIYDTVIFSQTQPKSEDSEILCIFVLQPQLLNILDFTPVNNYIIHRKHN